LDFAGVATLSRTELDKIGEELIQRLERIRQAKGMSKERFANAVLGISSPTYYRWVEEKLAQLPLKRVKELEELVERLERELEEAKA